MLFKRSARPSFALVVRSSEKCGNGLTIRADDRLVSRWVHNGRVKRALQIESTSHFEVHALLPLLFVLIVRAELITP